MAQSDRGYMAVFLRLAALLVAIVFVPLSVVILVASNLERQVFNPDAYKSSLERQGFYDHAPALLAAELYRSIASGETTADALKNLSQADLQSILAAIMPVEWLKTQTESAIGQFFKMLDSDGPPQIVISLAEVKQRMAGPPGVDVVNRVIASWPACTNQELLRAEQAIASSGDLSRMPNCSPPPPVQSQFAPATQAAARQIAANIPAEVNLAESFARGTAQDPRPTIRTVRQIIHLSPILPPLLLLLIAALAVRRLRDLRTWWGIPLLVVGVSGVVMALVISPLRAELILGLSGTRNLMPGSFQEVLSGVLLTIAQRAGLLIGVEATFTALLGLILLVSGVSIWRSDSPARDRSAINP